MFSMAGADLARAKEAMRGVISRPVKRQPPIRNQVVEAVANPQSLPGDARARLASMLYSKYGEQSRNILPYLGLGEEDQTIQGAF